jgi:penicillin-binding protein 1C
LPGPDPVGRRVCNPAAAWLIADILSDNQARALAFGLESYLRFDFPVACKTGTSSDFRDNWALGYTPEYTVGVWMGNFDGTPMDHVSGVSGAAPLLHDLFLHLHERFGTTWYARAAGLVQRRIHPISGRLWEGPGAVLEAFQANALPALAGAEDFDAKGRLRLPEEYRAWLAGSENWLGDGVVCDGRTPRGPLRLWAPLPGSVYYIDPDLPDSSRRLRIRAEGGAGVVWESDSLEIIREGESVYAIMEEGRHRLRARCAATGEEVETWLEIKSL